MTEIDPRLEEAWRERTEFEIYAAEAEEKLDKIRKLIRDDHLIEVMGTEYLAVPDIRRILDDRKN